MNGCAAQLEHGVLYNKVWYYTKQSGTTSSTARLSGYEIWNNYLCGSDEQLRQWLTSLVRYGIL